MVESDFASGADRRTVLLGAAAATALLTPLARAAVTDDAASVKPDHRINLGPVDLEELRKSLEGRAVPHGDAILAERLAQIGGHASPR